MSDYTRIDGELEDFNEDKQLYKKHISHIEDELDSLEDKYTELNQSLTDDIAELKDSLTELESSIQNVKYDFLGGRNLILNSESQKEISNSFIEYNLTDYAKTPSLLRDRDVTISFWAKSDIEGTRVDSYLRSYNGVNVNGWTSTGQITEAFAFEVGTEWQFIESHMTCNDNDNSITAAVRCNTTMSGQTVNDKATLLVRNVKCELGTHASDWVPAPEDE